MLAVESTAALHGQLALVFTPGSFSSGIPHTRMMREWIAVQPEKSFVGIPFQLEALRFNVPRLHIDFSVVKLEN